MKKALLIISLAVIVIFCSCKPLPQPSVYEISDAVKATMNCYDFLYADSDMAKILFGCDTNDYEEWSVEYSSLPGCADVIIVFKSKNAEIQKNTQSFLEAFRTDRLNDFKGYAPEEAKKLEDSKVLTFGSYDILVVTKDINKAENAVKGLF